jgi:hypothetical protein
MWRGVLTTSEWEATGPGLGPSGRVFWKDGRRRLGRLACRDARRAGCEALARPVLWVRILFWAFTLPTSRELSVYL